MIREQNSAPPVSRHSTSPTVPPRPPRPVPRRSLPRRRQHQSSKSRIPPSLQAFTASASPHLTRMLARLRMPVGDGTRKRIIWDPEIFSEERSPGRKRAVSSAVRLNNSSGGGVYGRDTEAPCGRVRAGAFIGENGERERSTGKRSARELSCLLTLSGRVGSPTPLLRTSTALRPSVRPP